ncbi:cysteine desulfurase, partial [Burkholderia multivorans]|nr:cysteine desulfurase [Burkholderia multivorans]
GDDALRELLAVHRDVPASRASGSEVPRYFIDETHAAEPQGQLYRGAHPPFDVNAIRRDFPILQERVNGKQLVWFDNAATTHKPQA